MYSRNQTSLKSAGAMYVATAHLVMVLKVRLSKKLPDVCQYDMLLDRIHSWFSYCTDWRKGTYEQSE
jgi:hypothetical protein